MATIEKRVTDGGTSYRVKVRLKGYPPETATFERLTDAKEWAAKTEADMKAGRHFGEVKRHTFQELADEYAPHAKDAKRFTLRPGMEITVDVRTGSRRLIDYLISPIESARTTAARER